MKTIYIADSPNASQRRTGYLVSVPRATLGIKNALHMQNANQRSIGYLVAVRVATLAMKIEKHIPPNRQVAFYLYGNVYTNFIHTYLSDPRYPMGE